MPPGRRPGSYVVLTRLGPAEHWLVRGSALEGERALSSSEGMRVVRGAIVTRAVNLSQLSTFVGGRRGFASALSRTASEQQRVLESALRLGQVVVVQRTRKLSRFSHEIPDVAPADSDFVPHEPVAPQEKHHIRRVELGNLFYWPSQIALIPTDKLDRSPWAALITAARHMEAHPGDKPVLAFHQTADEPEQTSERRSLATRAFIRDDRDAWVNLEAEHGNIADTQSVLAYLAKTKAWPTEVAVSGENDDRTKAAVLAFQHSYNMAYNESLYEDGVVGIQTLAAMFTVLKDDLSQWFSLNEADYAQLYHLPPEAYLACGSRFAGRPQYSIGTYSGTARTLDILFIPPNEDLSPEMTPAGVGVYVEDIKIEHLPIRNIRVPQTHLLIVRLIDRAGDPVATADYELRVGNDHRHGTTNDQGEIVEANLADGVPIVRLADGRLIVFHDRYEEAVSKHEAPERPQSPESLTEDEAGKHFVNESVEEYLLSD